MAHHDGSTDEKIRVHFVCLGNICRSPLAEGVFREHVRRAGLEDAFLIRSSGTGDWHVGEGADRRMHDTAGHYGIDLGDHRARQFAADDLAADDYVFVMDKNNLHDVLYFDDEDRHNGKVRLFREFDPDPGDYQVPDPYYGGERGFHDVYEIVDRTCHVILGRIVKERGLSSRLTGNVE